MKKILVVVLVHAMASMSLAAKTAKFEFTDNSKVPPQNVEAPSIQELGFLSDAEVAKMAQNFKEEGKRRPSSGSTVGTEDMLSKPYVEFRDKIIKARSGDQFFQIIKEYDAKYTQIPASANDLKFAVARMATWLPLRGVVWRMTPMVHKVVVTQEALLATLRNIAEQVKINEPDSHVEAQMLFLTMPDADLIGKEIRVESDFMTYLAKEVYPALQKAAVRLERLNKMANIQDSGQETPIVFDGRIRFGQNAFNSNYDAFERFKIVGEAERFAALARINRRMFGIATMVAYNWNGHLALRREIGKSFGVGAVESALFDALPGEDNVFVTGATREQRVAIVKKYSKLYTLVPNGQRWMRVAYLHLHKTGDYLSKTWDNIKKEDPNTVMQIDPEVLMGRKEQIEAGIVNLRKLTEADPQSNGSSPAVIRGALSGEELTVNLKGFYDNPPKDLKKLLPTSFAKNEDLEGLKAIPTYKSMTQRKGDVMELKFNDQSIKFRNYLYGRAKTWDISASGYGTLFPALKGGEDVARAMRIMNETRGARVVANGLTTFVR